MNFASLCSLAGRYENPIPPRCLAPIDFLKIPAQFASALWAALCSLLNISHSPTTAYRPQAKGLVELRPSYSVHMSRAAQICPGVLISLLFLMVKVARSSSWSKRLTQRSYENAPAVSGAWGADLGHT